MSKLYIRAVVEFVVDTDENCEVVENQLAERIDSISEIEAGFVGIKDMHLMLTDAK